MRVSCARYAVVPIVVLSCACGRGSSPAPGSTESAGPTVVKLDGSSTVFPISEAVAEEFQKVDQWHDSRHRRASPARVADSRSSAAAETDISDASRPISATEIEACAGRRRQLHRAARRLRRHRDRRQSQGHVDQRHHRRRAEEDLGARGTGQGARAGTRCGRAGRTARSTCSALASIPAPTTTSPKRSTARPRPVRGDFTSSEDDNVLVQGVVRRRRRARLHTVRLLTTRTRAG